MKRAFLLAHEAKRHLALAGKTRQSLTFQADDRSRKISGSVLNTANINQRVKFVRAERGAAGRLVGAQLQQLRDEPGRSSRVRSTPLLCGCAVKAGSVFGNFLAGKIPRSVNIHRVKIT